MSDLNKGSDYQRSLSRIEEKIVYREKAVKKAQRSYDKLEKQIEEKKRALREDDRTKRDILDRKLRSKRKDLNIATEELGDLVDRKIHLEDRGERYHNRIVEQTTNDIIEQLDSKRTFYPGSRGGPGAHKEYSTQESPIEGLKDVDFFDEEERINKNDPEGVYRDRRWVEEHMESDRRTEQDTDENIDKDLKRKARVLKPKSRYLGTVAGFDKYGNAILSFSNISLSDDKKDKQGIFYRGKKMGLKIGDKKFFAYRGENKRKDRFIFEFPPKRKKVVDKVQSTENSKTGVRGKLRKAA